MSTENEFRLYTCTCLRNAANSRFLPIYPFDFPCLAATVLRQICACLGAVSIPCVRENRQNFLWRFELKILDRDVRKWRRSRLIHAENNKALSSDDYSSLFVLTKSLHVRTSGLPPYSYKSAIERSEEDEEESKQKRGDGREKQIHKRCAFFGQSLTYFFLTLIKKAES